MHRLVHLPLFALLLLGSFLAAAEPGFQAEVKVSAPTRIDWEFAVSSFGIDKPKLPADYDSRKQRYQFFLPKDYDVKKEWPLVVFISPGDDPLGWRFWQKVCEETGMLFCAPYGAGNVVPVDQRTRMVLDVLDDVRRHYRIDPQQTYLAGFSGGGRMACALAFALPEYFGGVIPVCGTNPLHALPALRHRIRDRLSVAFVTGSGDFNRKENEDYMFPYFQELGIRSRLWVVPRMGHSVPGPDVLAEVHAWLAEDRKRRQADVKAFPGLAAAPDEVKTRAQQAAGQLEAAEAELKKPECTWEAVALLEGIIQRWGKTDSAETARTLLGQLKADPKKQQLLADQRGAEERRELTAQARALERFGRRRQALESWQTLAKNFADSEEGKAAATEARRLQADMAAAPKQPYLGVAFKDNGLVVGQVAAKGPADQGGVKTGDTLLQLGTAKLASQADLIKALALRKPGEEVALDVKRDDKTVTLTITLGGRSPPGDD
jgi:pimeloyl-ACP methyl ester carboxylesterase